jgi:hypothetical protein
MITDDLKRGWYNELAYALPLKVSTLGVSFQDVRANEPQATVRYSFPSWRITTAYYATYFYLRTLTLQKQPDIRLREHSATISSFKSNLLSPLSSVIWKFPLDIIYIPGKRRIRSGRLIRSMPHLKRRYCARPRTPHRSPVQSFERIYNVFRYGGRKMGRPTPYGLFDFLHDFRVWANYLEIDNLLNLNGSFYKSFLDQNLSLILFFIAAVTELSYIAVFGAGRYSRCLQRFHDLAVRSGSVTEEDFLRVPHHQRMQIYRELGLVKAEVTRLLPDENAVFVR